MQILYAGDDFQDFDFFLEAVRVIDPKHEVIHVCDGNEVLEYLDVSFQSMRNTPDIIFLDIHMPGMDGKVCLRTLRQVKALQSTPIVMFTTSPDERDQKHCLELGASGVIQKHFKIDTMIASLRAYLI